MALTPKAIERRKGIKERLVLVEAAKVGPCTDCGNWYPPECMDLDHVWGVKLFGISRFAAKLQTTANVIAEIAKCQLRCPTCHRLRHYYLGLLDVEANGIDSAYGREAMVEFLESRGHTLAPNLAIEPLPRQALQRAVPSESQPDPPPEPLAHG